MKKWVNPKILGLTTMLVGMAIPLLFAQSVPQPVLTIAPTGTNQLLLSITNGVTFTNYEIFRTPILNSAAYPWAWEAVGMNGQTNFVVDMGNDFMGYFKALVGADQDGDRVPDWMDANPNDPMIGALSITIDSPTNNAVVQ